LFVWRRKMEVPMKRYCSHCQTSCVILTKCVQDHVIQGQNIHPLIRNKKYVTKYQQGSAQEAWSQNYRLVHWLGSEIFELLTLSSSYKTDSFAILCSQPVKHTNYTKSGAIMCMTIIFTKEHICTQKRNTKFHSKNIKWRFIWKCDWQPVLGNKLIASEQYTAILYPYNRSLHTGNWLRWHRYKNMHQELSQSSPYNLPWEHTRGAEVQLCSFFNLGARWGSVINPTSQMLYPRNDPVPIKSQTGFSHKKDTKM
jgi:hypothetical protein